MTMDQYKRERRAVLEAIYAAENAFAAARVAGDDVVCQKASVTRREAIAALCDLVASEPTSRQADPGN